MTVNNIDPMAWLCRHRLRQVRDAQAGALAAELIGEGGHVLGGSPKSVQGCDDKGVALY